MENVSLYVCKRKADRSQDRSQVLLTSGKFLKPVIPEDNSVI